MGCARLLPNSITMSRAVSAPGVCDREHSDNGHHKLYLISLAFLSLYIMFTIFTSNIEHISVFLSHLCSGLLTRLASRQPHSGACQAAVSSALSQVCISYRKNSNNLTVCYVVENSLLQNRGKNRSKKKRAAHPL